MTCAVDAAAAGPVASVPAVAVGAARVPGVRASPAAARVAAAVPVPAAAAVRSCAFAGAGVAAVLVAAAVALMIPLRAPEETLTGKLDRMRRWLLSPSPSVVQEA